MRSLTVLEKGHNHAKNYKQQKTRQQGTRTNEGLKRLGALANSYSS